MRTSGHAGAGLLLSKSLPHQKTLPVWLPFCHFPPMPCPPPFYLLSSLAISTIEQDSASALHPPSSASVDLTLPHVMVSCSSTQYSSVLLTHPYWLQTLHWLPLPTWRTCVPAGLVAPVVEDIRSLFLASPHFRSTLWGFLKATQTLATGHGTVPCYPCQQQWSPQMRFSALVDADSTLHSLVTR